MGFAHEAEAVVSERQVFDHDEDVFEELSQHGREGGDGGERAFVVAGGGASAEGRSQGLVGVEDTLFGRVHLNLYRHGRRKLPGRRV